MTLLLSRVELTVLRLMPKSVANWLIFAPAW
jgi:hypothetical protein